MQRYDIILGTTRGLAYLHEDFHVCIIHRDIKTGNILLDDDLQPKIADFGLARLLPEDQSHLSTRFAGTLGYTAPEYAIHGKLNIVGDNMQGAVFGELLDCLLKPTNIKEKISSLMLLASLGSECEETMLKQLMLLEFGKRTMLLKLKRPLKLLKELDSKFRKVLRIDVILVV
ncbi:cysteine-rich receptor-like protein kinase 3 isoform X1 [Trifolium pratense]|uniref:cysteine-rich receptor-like protein kinase 3 isoform X1 n=1 Tax=Trifolium pratense TaxID=57577 RepID=UPI001E695B02|nr:cysteine-rich receptor-like protein kinase 3 isoform X1 [Trifolium pratense]XP_045793276.1 cysteine-rich receptor-like protein kinase 3 isoform X1 [Trifolium pratense]XP_045793277.1 cysteine-rich receptor-like protein kinase 3 isoform X1 [Trifolium pratense]XP_045793278.1 cysteine-rich receptor-like protein kinase 3 isoform X1 [Trifolium pratense]